MTENLFLTRINEQKRYGFRSFNIHRYNWYWFWRNNNVTIDLNKILESPNYMRDIEHYIENNLKPTEWALADCDDPLTINFQKLSDAVAFKLEFG